MLFDKEKRRKLILPIMIEQLLSFSVGVIDMIMVANAGEAAISGVSLVDTISNLVICLFNALATGGAVVCAQYIGKKDKEKASLAANQLVLVMVSFSVCIMMLCLGFCSQIIGGVYGKVDRDISKNAELYFVMIAISLPFLGVYNGCAALFRSIGNTSICMKISFLMNACNVCGNAIAIYGYHSGSRGVGAATMVSRMIGGCVIFLLLRNPNLPISIARTCSVHYHWSMIRRILYIGIPNGLENSMIQIGKVLLASLISTFGRVQIAGNAIANGITLFGIIPGNAIGTALLTVVGQCIGAKDSEQAYKNTKSLLKEAYVYMIGLNVVMGLISQPLIELYGMSTDVNLVAYHIMIGNCIACCLVWQTSFIIPHALRAANDVRFTMAVSIISMWVFRVGGGYLLAKGMKLQALGVWLAMFMDWTFRSVLFVWRFRKRRLDPVKLK